MTTLYLTSDEGSTLNKVNAACLDFAKGKRVKIVLNGTDSFPIGPINAKLKYISEHSYCLLDDFQPCIPALAKKLNISAENYKLFDQVCYDLNTCL